MIYLTLTADEVDTLTRALDRYVSDLRMEIANTDNQRFRNELKQEKTTLKTILGSLHPTEMVAANA